MWAAALDALQDSLGWFFTAAAALVATWVGWVSRSIVTNRTRLALLEGSVSATAAALPRQFDEIKLTLRDMRNESIDGRDEAILARERIYGQIDDVRKELKVDIEKAADIAKAAETAAYTAAAAARGR